jgi:hypothetical protein
MTLPFANLDDFVKSPSAALRGNFVVAAHPVVRLTPQFLRALHLELFTKSSFTDFLRDHQPGWFRKKSICGVALGLKRAWGVGWRGKFFPSLATPPTLLPTSLS